MPFQDKPFPGLSDKILKTEDNFKGRSYGDILADWANWLLGTYPDYRDVGSILYCRGSIGDYSNPNNVYDRTGRSGINIFEDTSVFIPVMTAMFHAGHSYLGSKAEDVGALRAAVRADLSEGGEMWARIQGDSGDVYRVVGDLMDYYVESPLFTLTVSAQNPFKDMLEIPMEAGTYSTIIGAYCILIKGLPIPSAKNSTNYYLWFGGKGRDVYHTDAYYQINVRKGVRNPSFAQDKSGDTSATPNKTVARPPQ